MGRMRSGWAKEREPVGRYNNSHKLTAITCPTRHDEYGEKRNNDSNNEPPVPHHHSVGDLDLTTSLAISLAHPQHVQGQTTHVWASFHQARLFLQLIAASRQPGVTILGPRHYSMAAHSAQETLGSRTTPQRYSRRVKCSSIFLRDRSSVVAVAETPLDISGPPGQATPVARVVERQTSSYCSGSTASIS